MVKSLQFRSSGENSIYDVPVEFCIALYKEKIGAESALESLKLDLKDNKGIIETVALDSKGVFKDSFS